ncbi:MAG: type II toxin-antitoxin system VapC family toxin [Coriobacteriia bacterium]|nr:type II toxin-antitoxin system VapC family toxin [Coriobacteriia bacterium]
MSAIVLDASVAISLVVEERGTAAAIATVAGHDVLVPDLFWPEVSHALVRKAGSGAIARADAAEAYALLRRLVDRTVGSEPLGPGAMTLALDLGHPAYDCVYLAAAIAHGAPLLTADRALHAAATAAGHGDAVLLIHA